MQLVIIHYCFISHTQTERERASKKRKKIYKQTASHHYSRREKKTDRKISIPMSYRETICYEFILKLMGNQTILYCSKGSSKFFFKPRTQRDDHHHDDSLCFMITESETLPRGGRKDSDLSDDQKIQLDLKRWAGLTTVVVKLTTRRTEKGTKCV